MEHGTVGRTTTTEVVPLVNTSEAVTFGHSRHIDVVVLGENIRQNLVPDVHFPSVRYPVELRGENEPGSRQPS